MKGRSNDGGGVGKRYEFGFWTELEIEVANLLLDLGEVKVNNQVQYILPLVWGGKKRRSAILHHKREGNGNKNNNDDDGLIREKKIKTEATSPSTPLCFLPSECDEPKQHTCCCTQLIRVNDNKKKRAIVRTRKEWFEIIEGLNQRKLLLAKEVDLVKAFYNKLKTYNLALKAKRSEINCPTKKAKSESEINRGLQSSRIKKEEQHPVCVFPHQQQQQQQQACSYNYRNSSGIGIGMMNGRCIPDLNVAWQAEETFGMIMESTRKKLLAAQARKMRRITLNNKKMLMESTRKTFMAAQARNMRRMALNNKKIMRSLARNNRRL